MLASSPSISKRCSEGCHACGDFKDWQNTIVPQQLRFLTYMRLLCICMDIGKAKTAYGIIAGVLAAGIPFFTWAAITYSYRLDKQMVVKEVVKNLKVADIASDTQSAVANAPQQAADSTAPVLLPATERRSLQKIRSAPSRVGKACSVLSPLKTGILSRQLTKRPCSLWGQMQSKILCCSCQGSPGVQVPACRGLTATCRMPCWAVPKR